MFLDMRLIRVVYAELLLTSYIRDNLETSGIRNEENSQGDVVYIPDPRDRVGHNARRPQPSWAY